MRFTVDDATLPMGGLLNVTLGYLLGLGLIGYMTILTWIKERGKRSSWPQWFTNLLTGLHFLFGLTAMTYAPASVLHRLKTQGGTGTMGAFAFLATIVVVVCLASLIAKDWNLWFRNRENKS